jgi:MFS transporter, UMF1 family
MPPDGRSVTASRLPPEVYRPITPVTEHGSMDAGRPHDTQSLHRRSKGTGREIGAWAVYESASNAFNTLIITFIFSRYFQGVIAPDEAIGLTWWTRALNISAILVALSMPVMGAIADFSGRKKQFLFVTTAGCIAATSLLFFMQPGMMLTAVLIFIVANVLFEAAAVFYNGFLPELTTTERMGRVSGFGWSMGYVGGLVCLIIALGMLRMWEPADPYLNVRATTLLAAVWYLVLAIPLFLMVRERQRRRSAPVRMYIEAGFRRVARTFHQLRTFREAAKLLLARLVYNDGLVVLFGMAAIYVGTVYGMGFDDIIVLAIVVNIAAAIGAFAFGFLNDYIGAKKTIAITLIVLTAATLLGATAPDMRTFWVAAIVIGLMVGPNQSASRAMLATFTPERKQGEFFGFFAFSGKLSSVAGPLAYGTVAAVTGSQRIAMASIMVFFIVGFALLMLVDEQRGVEMARKATLAGVGEQS